MDDKFRHLEERIAALASKIDIQGQLLNRMAGASGGADLKAAPSVLYANNTEIAISAAGAVLLFPADQIKHALGYLDPGLDQGRRAAFKRLVQPGMVYVDIGASAGAIAAYAAKNIGPNGLVVTAEPLVAMAENITRNVLLNSEHTPHRHFTNAVSDTAGVLPLWYNARDNRQSTFYRDIGSTESGDWVRASVESVRMRDIIPAGDTRDMLIKVDTDGAEMHILRDTLVTLDAFAGRKAQMLITYDPASLKRGGAAPEDFMVATAALGDNAVYIDPVSGENTHYFTDNTFDEAGTLLLTLPSS